MELTRVGIVDNDYAAEVTASETRVKEARRIAENLRHDDTLHRLAMKIVFLLEDVHETFVQLQTQANAKPKQNQRW